MNSNYETRSKRQKDGGKKTYAKKRPYSKINKQRKQEPPQKKQRLCLKRGDSASGYLTSQRLTNQVGLYTKGKISNSISRIEKTLPNEIKARADQDLHRILKIQNGCKNNYISNHDSVKSNDFIGSDTSCASVRSSSPASGFQGEAWKQKLEKSVGPLTRCSVLSSVLIPPKDASPLSDDFLQVHETITRKIYPSISNANLRLFPNLSNIDKLKHDLSQIIKAQDVYEIVCSQEKTSVPPVSLAPSPVEEKTEPGVSDFKLNPVLTCVGSSVQDLSKLFPEFTPSSSSEESSDLDPSSTFGKESADESLQDGTYSHPSSFESSRIIVNGTQRKSNSRQCSFKSSRILVPSTPACNEDSPTWKYIVSPVTFSANLPVSPQFFRQKMY